MSRPPKLSAEDQALWRRVAASVRPLRRPAPVEPRVPAVPATEPAPPPTARPSARKSSPKGPAPAPARTHSPPKPDRPADRGGEKRVRRGRVEIVGSLDLHGCTQVQAQAEVAAFVRQVAGQGGGVVIIVTGKGGRLKGGEATPGVLRQRLPDWLAAPDLRPLVAGYAEAHRSHGGAGATYVFVRRPG